MQYVYRDVRAAAGSTDPQRWTRGRTSSADPVARGWEHPQAAPCKPCEWHRQQLPGGSPPQATAVCPLSAALSPPPGAGKHFPFLQIVTKTRKGTFLELARGFPPRERALPAAGARGTRDARGILHPPRPVKGGCSPGTLVPQAPPRRHRVMQTRGRSVGWARAGGPPPSRGALSRHTARTPPPPAPRVLVGRSNFCIPASPGSWVPEAAPSLGAVPWQRAASTEPDGGSRAGLTSSPSHPRESGAGPGAASAAGCPRTPAPAQAPAPSRRPAAAPLPRARRFLSASLPSSIGCPPFGEGWSIWRAKCPRCRPGTGSGICCSGTKDGRTTTGECGAVPCTPRRRTGPREPSGGGRGGRRRDPGVSLRVRPAPWLWTGSPLVLPRPWVGRIDVGLVLCLCAHGWHRRCRTCRWHAVAVPSDVPVPAWGWESAWEMHST